MPLMPGIARDLITISRPSSSGVDADGNYGPSLGAPTSVLGSWGLPSDVEIQAANTRGQTVNAAIAIPSGTRIAPGDVVTVRGHTYAVTVTRDVRLHMRALLREYS